MKSYLLSQVKIPEVLVDILFNIIREITWSPDYLPYRERGLPTANVYAIRLLAHILLFEIDSYLKESTNNNFVRWMDDIVFGFNSLTEGKNLLTEISLMLNSRGLALNLAKTSILKSEEVLFHYQVDSNKYLNFIDREIKNGNRIDKAKLNSEFKKHLKNKKAKLWNKITKRYFTIYKKINSTYLTKYAVPLFFEFPSLRPNILTYLSNNKIDSKIKDIYKSILSNTYHEDVTYFLIAKSLTDINLKRNKENATFINDLIKEYPKFTNPLDFY